LKVERCTLNVDCSLAFQRSTSNAQLSSFNCPQFAPDAELWYGLDCKEGQMASIDYDLEERLLSYAAQIVRLVEKLPQTRAGNHIAAQLLRAGTSALPNHGEAQAAESRKDFIHKLSICLKELKETRRWLRLAQSVPLVEPQDALDLALRETEELIRIFAASLRTARGRKAGH
jgi:four helix bundle protein